MHQDLELIDIQQAAQILNLKVSRLRTAIFKREIGFIKLNGVIRFTKKHLFDWVKRSEVQPKSEPRSM